ncbi:MAG: alcohol dehydrogenase catalytic domain-containing protein [Desulfobacterales bacterium]|jgi:2-desacetyl-2-hydroxyethyl bacteriochlorophyllide A dehydrogenase
MIGVRLEDGRPVVRRDLPEPLPADKEALIRVLCAGICGTDLALIGGFAEFSGILGHEFLGEVIEAPGASELSGRRVVGRITISCGACSSCLAGRPGHCEKRRVVGIRGADGVFAQRCCLPVANLVSVPDSVSDEAAVFAEPLAAALRITEQVRVNESDRILVIGAGNLGQLIARVLSGLGCRPDVVARHPGQRRRLAEEGICWMPEGEGEPHSYDLVVEASGGADGIAEACRFVRPEGTVVLKSSLSGPVPVDLSDLMVREITLIGSRCGPLDAAVEWLACKRIDPLDLIETRFSLTEAPAAFARAAAPGAMKVLIRC